MKTVTLNKDQGLFVIPCGDGYSCLGFDVCRKWSSALESELGLEPYKGPIDSLDAYRHYESLLASARKRNADTGWRSESELHPLLKGLEGKRVEVTSSVTGETRRFWVGKSTGFVPCHLEIARRNCLGGEAVTADFDSVRVLYGR